MLQCRSAPVASRVKLCCATVFAALLWLSETWYPTKYQSSRIESWAARILARIVGVRRWDGEDINDFWRRLHRTGHNILKGNGGSIETRRKRQLHSFAGHLARSDGGLLYDALRTRSIQWWRECQARKVMLHPRRFKAWRWEEQLVTHFGVSRSFFIDENTGWLLKAQGRQVWQAVRHEFSCKKA